MSDVDSDIPKPKPSAAGREGEEDGGARGTERERLLSSRAVDSEGYHTPVEEHIDPQIKMNVAGDHASKGLLLKESPPKGDDAVERIIKQIKPDGDTYASERERSHRGGEGYYPSASWGMSRSGSKVTFAEEGGDSPQDATASPSTPLLNPHLADAPSPPPHTYGATPPPRPRSENYPNSANAFGGATRKGGYSKGRGGAEKHAKGPGYGARLESGGESGVPRAGLPRAHEVQDAVDPLPAMGRDPPPRPDEAAAQALQPDPIFFPNRTRVQKCRHCCVWYTVVFTVLCCVVIAVWVTAISKRSHVDLWTSLDEIMKVEANSLTTGWLTLLHDVDSSGTGIMTTYHVPCNKLRKKNTTTDPINTLPIRVNESQNERLGLSHHVFYIEKGGNVDIGVYVNFTTSVVNIEFLVFQSKEYMDECEKQNCTCSSDDPLPVPCLNDFIVSNGIGRYDAKVSGHHYMSTKVGADADAFPFNLSFRFVLTTQQYDVSEIIQAGSLCQGYHCRVQYSWFPLEIFQRSCVLLQISDSSSEQFSTLFPIQQALHRRNDMIGYFVAIILVTLIGLFLAFSCPIYESAKNCLQHRHTRRVRRYLGLHYS